MQGTIETIKRIGIKNIILIFISIALSILLIWYGMKQDKVEPNPEGNAVSKAQVAKAVSLLYHTVDEMKSTKTDEFPREDEQWYEKYVNTMYEDTFFTTKEIPANERILMMGFTYKDLDNLYTNMGIVDEALLSFVKNNSSSDIITIKQWRDIYSMMVEKLDTENKLTKKSFIVAGTIARDPKLPQWKAVTTEGDMNFEGLAMDYYIDKSVNAITRDNEIIVVLDVNETEVTYDNSWIISMTDGEIKAFVEGCIREFTYEDKSQSYSNVVADLQLKDSKLVNIAVKKDTISGKVLTSSKEKIEVENLGEYEVAQGCHVYRIYGNIKKCDISEMLVGYDAQKFILNEDNKICAIVLDRDIKATNIRVLLKNNGFKDILHDYVKITSDVGCTVNCSDGRVLEIEPGNEYTFAPDSDFFDGGRIKLTPKKVDGKITIGSLERGYGAPSYRGTLELVKNGEKILIINELPLEQYLYSVVPSEMPWDYNFEALKAQAICARSFAYMHIMNNGYSQYGAHVDDSTSYQVYNNSKEQEVTNKAVDETYGQVITCNKNVISAYFFSTSCGITTTSEVWGSLKAYTSAKFLGEENGDISLNSEADFDAFIRTNYKTIDSEYPWYRWKTTFTLEQLTNSINGQIGSIKQENIKVQDKDDKWSNMEVKSVGEVKKIELGDRGQGGVLNFITIHGTENTVRIYKEYNIRKVLNPNGITINRGDGEKVTTMSMLPSGFFVMDEVIKDNRLAAYTFVGGGYGHGVGMSQNGANTMAKNGKQYEDILKFFYSNIEIIKKY